MKLKDAMIVWNPNREPFDKIPLVGRAAVTEIPEDPELKAYRMSIGACDLSWKEADDEGRRNLLQDYFSRMIHEDNIDEVHLREVLSAIEDIDVNSLTSDPPSE